MLHKDMRYVRVTDSVLPTQDSFEKMSNNIPCVNIFQLLLPTLNFKFQIQNHYCAPNSHHDNLINCTFTMQYRNFPILVHI